MSVTADKRIDLSILPQPSTEYLNEFENIIPNQFGIKITNLSGHRIGYSWARPGPWRPVTGFRETLRGILNTYAVEVGHAFDIYLGSNDKIYMQGEYDWNFYIRPTGSYIAKFGFSEIDCEVTPAENYYDTEWFPLKGSDKPSPLLFREICLYGPYVVDEGHDDGKEIHPIDAIWWPEGNDQLKVVLLQDAAKGRFREKGMFSKNSKDAHFYDWKPWIEYPQLEEIRIPFTYNPLDKKYQHILVEINTAMDITTHLQTGWFDSDDGPQHQLLQAGGFPLPILVRVTELSDNQYIVVQFTDLTRDAGGIVRGYVQLVAALGDKLNKHEGVLELTLTFKQEDNT
jgi:hypothetical protein